MAHHAWLVQRGLSIQNEHVPISKMAIDLFVDRRCPCVQALARRTGAAVRRSQQLVGNSSSLFNSELVLHMREISAAVLRKVHNDTDKRLLMAILILHHRRTGVTFGSGNNPLA